MQNTTSQTILFVINAKSGTGDKDYKQLIETHFAELPHKAEVYEMEEACKKEDIDKAINKYKPTKVVAIGGDGTVKLVAEVCMKAKLPVGIVPGGSANGMAKELGIPEDTTKALNAVVNGKCKKIHLIYVNDELCIHLSDIGFNAFIIKKFDSLDSRGMLGYAKAAWQVLREHSEMEVEIKVNGKLEKKCAAMIVLANATKYGTGALINPDGSLEDDLFEVIVMKKLSLSELFKMAVTRQSYNPKKTEVYQTDNVRIVSKRKVHFQVDGEYLGQVQEIKAKLAPDSLEVIVPDEA